MSWKQLKNCRVSQDLRERLEEEEGNTASLHGQRRQLEGELTELKRDLESLESTLAKTEKEKQVEGRRTKPRREEMKCSSCGDFTKYCLDQTQSQEIRLKKIIFRVDH